MQRRISATRLAVLVVATITVTAVSVAKAAFIVEADNVAPAGKANDHFAATPATGFSLTAAPSTAAGLTGNQSAFGNPANSTGPDLYTFSYTPGTDADNTVFTIGDALGTHRLEPANTLVADTQTSTGLVGGITGTYKVYITWPNSGNVSTTGSIVTVNGDDGPIVLNPVNQNGDPAFPATFTAVGEAGKNKWLNIGTVDLTAGSTYTVTMQANTASFTSQRVHGVMWELQPIPEPTSLGLLGLGAVGLLARRRH
jgi:hypothetical protein